MKEDWEYKVWDNYYDNCANIWRPDLNHPDPEKRKFAEHMVKSMQEAKLYEYTAVKDPFCKGHTVVVKHKRGEPRPKVYFEEMWEKLSFIEKLKRIARQYLGSEE